MQAAGHRGIAIAMSLSTGFQALLLYAAWNRRSQNRGSRQVYFSFLKMATLSAGIGILLEWMKALFTGGSPPADVLACIWVVACTIIVGVGITIFIGQVLRMEEIAEPLKNVRREISRRMFRKN
jgi:peptidoglycan biosynthesis protein MviN/MurJ (putative lipid II flippase)